MGNGQRLRQLPRRLTAMSLFDPDNKSLCLEQLCSANYHKLLRLVPNLVAIHETTVGIALSSPVGRQGSQLILKVVERSPYTLTVELSHSFGRPENTQFLPALLIRVYLDAKMAEVISDYAHKAVPQAFAHFGFSKAIMDYKWRLNYFLQKWLEHCLKQDYLFGFRVDLSQGRLKSASP